MDEPEFLIEQAVAQHQGMIKQMKGVPGVLPERFAEGFNVKHCALSLVGEPIMVSKPPSMMMLVMAVVWRRWRWQYPHINRFVRLLHERNISSFLVTNAQFPGVAGLHHARRHVAAQTACSTWSR